jgi:hypothetical protein
MPTGTRLRDSGPDRLAGPASFCHEPGDGREARNGRENASVPQTPKTMMTSNQPHARTGC